jgi:hypothetical protein
MDSLLGRRHIPAVSWRAVTREEAPCGVQRIFLSSGRRA